MTWNAAVCHKLDCAKNLWDIKRNCITYLNLKILILRLCSTVASDTKYFLKLTENRLGTLIHKNMYCLLQLCHHKYTDTKTLSKRHVVDLKTFFVITSSHPTLHFTISSLVLLPSPVTLSVSSFSAAGPFF